MITELNDRAQNILRLIVDSYLETGAPTGSRALAAALGLGLSPATIRGVMADLEGEGLLFAPHISAGRLPTQAGLRLYVDGLMEIGDLNREDRAQIETRCRAAGQSVTEMLENATAMLSGLSAAAALVVAPKTDKPLRQIQFLPLEPGRALVVLVMQDNMVENRVIDVPPDLPQSALTAASNYLTAHLAGRTAREAQGEIEREIGANRSQLDLLTADLVRRGLALAPQGAGNGNHIIIRGQSRLLQDVRALEEIEQARQLFAALEEQQTAMRLLDAAQGGDGVQIFIGTENRVFEQAGWSMVIAPYRSAESRIIGAIGVLGPARLNYGRVIPVVDYTAQLMGRLLGS